jgi:hypothetical protein
MQVDLSEKAARHVLMPFWVFGNICLLEGILSRVKTLLGDFVELDLFRRRLRHHVQLITVARVSHFELQGILLGPGICFLYGCQDRGLRPGRQKSPLLGRWCNSECAKRPRGEHNKANKQ